LADASDDEIIAVNLKLKEATIRSHKAEKEAGEANLVLQEWLQGMALAKFNQVTFSKNAKSACIYAKAAKRAAAIQGQALCAAKKKSIQAEYDAVVYLNQYEKEGRKTPRPTLIPYDPVKGWEACTGFSLGKIVIKGNVDVKGGVKIGGVKVVGDVSVVNEVVIDGGNVRVEKFVEVQGDAKGSGVNIKIDAKKDTVSGN